MLKALKGGFVAATILIMAGTALAEELQTIRIGLSSVSLPAASARIAKEMGLYEKHGLKAEITPMDNGSVATMGLLAGSLDFTASGPTDVVIGRAHGQDLVAVAGLYHGFSAVLVLSKSLVDKLGVAASAPIQVRLKALNGAVIASPSATSTYTFALKSAAEANGANVSFTYMAQPAMVAALESGVIQGFIASSPFYAIPVRDGKAVVWIDGPKGEFPPESSAANAITLNAKGAFAAANPALIAKVRAVFTELANTAKEHPEQVRAAIARLFPNIDPKTLDLVYATEAQAFSNASPLTAAEMAREVAFTRLSGIELPRNADLNPAAMLVP
jgi:ABC-type nitrate/sulfonate/bicarbonate transport system substrate-binding protein